MGALMAGPSTEDLLIEIRADQKLLVADLQKARRSVKDFADNTEKTGGVVGKAFDSATAAVARFAGPAGVALAVAGLVQLGNTAIAFGDNIADTSKQLGLSAEAFQELGFAAQQSGVNVSEFNVGFRTMNRVVGDALSGNKQAIETLERLGLTVNDFIGLNAEQSFNRFADALQRIPDHASRAAAAADIFGKSGAAIAVMAEKGADGVEKLKEAARTAGVVLDEEMIRELAEAKDKVDALQQVTEALKIKSTADLAELAVGWAKVKASIAGALSTLVEWGRENKRIDEMRARIAAANPDNTVVENTRILEQMLASEESRGSGGGPQNGRVYKPKTKPKTGPTDEEKKAAEERQKEIDKWLDQTRTANQKIEDDYSETMSIIDKLEKGRYITANDALMRRLEADANYYDALKALDEKSNAELREQHKELQEQLDKELEEMLEKAGSEMVIDIPMPEVNIDPWTLALGDLQAAGEETFGNLLDAVGNFAETGKLSLDRFFRAYIANLLKAKLMESLTGLFGGLAGKGGFLGAIGSAFGGKAAPTRAAGGRTSVGSVYQISGGSHQKKVEYFKPDVPGTISPGAPSSGGASAVRVEVINKGTPQKAVSAQATQSPDGLVATIILDDLKRAGPISSGMQGAFGLQRGRR